MEQKATAESAGDKFRVADEKWAEVAPRHVREGLAYPVPRRNAFYIMNPNTKEIPSAKSQFCPRSRCFGAWDLELFWCLELGVWCFALSGSRDYQLGFSGRRSSNSRTSPAS